MKIEDKQYNVVTSADMDNMGKKEEPVVEKTEEEKAAIEAKAAEEAALEAESELLTEEEKALPEDEQAKVKKTRISKNKRELLEAQAALKEKSEALEAAQSKLKELTPVPKLKDKPKLADFGTADEYEAALSSWADEQAQVKAQIEIENRMKLDAFKSRQTEFMAKHADYRDTLKASSVVVPAHIEEAILDSEFAPDILYYLAKNEKEADKLNGKYGMKELGAIERMLKAEQKAPAKEEKREDFKSTPDLKIVESKKPVEPIKPIRGGNTDLETTISSDGKFTGDYQTFKRLSKEGKIK